MKKVFKVIFFVTVSILYFQSEHAIGQAVNSGSTTNSREQELEQILLGEKLNIDLLEIEKRAQNGDVAAQFELGFKYDLADNLKQAFFWYKIAAESGNATAQNNLAVMYGTGRGVPQNYNMAIFWYEKAANSGFTGAQNNLGVLYANGNGIPQNYIIAHKWFNLAASGNYELAADNRKKLGALMTPAQLAEAQRLATAWQPMIEAPQSEKEGIKLIPVDFDPFAKTEDKSMSILSLISVNLIIFIFIAISPPLIIRYKLVKRPIRKRYALLICISLWLLNFIIFASPGHIHSSKGFLNVAAIASFFIMTRVEKRKGVRN